MNAQMTYAQMNTRLQQIAVLQTLQGCAILSGTSSTYKFICWFILFYFKPQMQSKPTELQTLEESRGKNDAV